MTGLHVFSVWFLVMHFLRLLYIGYILKIHLYINSAIIYRCYVANNFFAKVHIFFLNLTLLPRKISKKKRLTKNLTQSFPNNSDDSQPLQMMMKRLRWKSSRM